ncbi:hypothetical protein O181_096005 [Austropuccinia psidii MF-1]|uniref:beta-glucosidase n=1 Tax=Austropuccinia psidii MF-1 TaxID=1389203 RepID=A0A9Q3J4X4_9BASI|nr:hypothetical protein [Austropuccinia psidii MF-1]
MPGFMAYGMPSEPNPAIATHSYWGSKLVEAIKNGSVPMDRIDDMVTRIISTYYKQGQDKLNYPKTEKLKQNGSVAEDHYRLIREVGAASMVLLKNFNDTLPLPPPMQLQSILVLGSDASANPQGPNSCVDRACNTGTLALGWGSGTSEFPYLIAPDTAIHKYVIEENSNIKYRAISSDVNYSQIRKAALQADVALVHVSADSGEGYLTVEGNAGDRNNLSLWHSGDELILKTAEVCQNVVVIVHAVGPVDMERWIDHPNVTAVLLAGLPGQETGNSEIDVLWGKVNPSGRLPFTIAKSRKDYPADVLYNSTMAVPQITYSERMEIDYRHFDTQNITPRFEFGFGLSYSKFDYQSLVIHSAAQSQNTMGNLFEDVVKVEFELTNVGRLPGHEVTQLYLGFPSQIHEPPKVLRGFERVYLNCQQREKVVLNLRRKDLSYWDVASQRWLIPHGQFKVMIGSSSRRILLEDVLNIAI